MMRSVFVFLKDNIVIVVAVLVVGAICFMNPDAFAGQILGAAIVLISGYATSRLKSKSDKEKIDAEHEHAKEMWLLAEQARKAEVLRDKKEKVYIDFLSRFNSSTLEQLSSDEDFQALRRELQANALLLQVYGNNRIIAAMNEAAEAAKFGDAPKIKNACSKLTEAMKDDLATV